MTLKRPINRDQFIHLYYFYVLTNCIGESFADGSHSVHHQPDFVTIIRGYIA